MKEDLQLHYLTPAIPPERVQHLVIFLHGFPDSCQIFRHYLQSELAACARLVALDLPGFGGSDSLPRYGPNQVLSTVARAIGLLKERYLPEKRNGEQCVLVGHDWGGIVAWRTAMETTGLIDSVVIINAPLVRQGSCHELSALYANNYHQPQLFLRNLSLRFEKAASLFKKDRNPTHGNVFSQAKALAGPAVKQFFMSGYVRPSTLSSTD